MSLFVFCRWSYGIVMWEVFTIGRCNVCQKASMRKRSFAVHILQRIRFQLSGSAYRRRSRIFFVNGNKNFAPSLASH